METLSKNKIKWARSLRLKKNRDKEGCFIVEGQKMVLEIKQNHPELIEFICTTEPIENLDFFSISEHDMKSLTSFSTPSSYLAVVKKPEFDGMPSNLTLVVDGVQDPGNLGTIIRTADWFGVNNIVCSNETTDAYNTKTIQATMGSIFHVKIVYTDLVDYLNTVNIPVYGALMDGVDLNKTEIPDKAILIVGNEGNGITAKVIEQINHPIHITGKGKAESLNVAVATGILLAAFSGS